eukprot:TRINITY_DN588_c1_g1_i1.p1 TRINITY_DN588_c1_g1~~TRINITY_DN588_c1_g1_i1.p1  ORF type:complete len:475 (+),score=36.48 TRINITY_DN588_c1_g1_i1:99-1523(+)
MENIADSRLHIGVVKSLGASFGLISCPETGYDRDVFLSYHRVCKGDVSQLQEGDTVAFTIHENARGMPQCSAPLWKLMGTPWKRVQVEPGAYMGKVKEVTQSMVNNGCAFVDCQEIKETYDCDCYIYYKVFEECGLQAGDLISFNIHVNDARRPQLNQPCWKLVSPETWLENWPIDLPKQADDRPRQADDSRRDTAHGYEKRQKYEDRPWSSASYARSPERDSHSGGGSAVKRPPWRSSSPDSPAFEDGARGSSSRREAPAPSRSYTTWDRARSPPRTSRREYMGRSSRSRSPIARARTYTASSHAGPQSWSTKSARQYFVGTAKIVDNFKGYSLIECPEAGYRHDIYCPKYTVEPSFLEKGDQILFPIFTNKDGKPQASVPVWKLVGKFEGQTAGALRYEGTLRRIHNGNGFVECREIAEQFGGCDAFMHSRVIEACGVDIGDKIRFDLHISQSGQPQVSAPCWKCLRDTVQE